MACQPKILNKQAQHKCLTLFIGTWSTKLQLCKQNGSPIKNQCLIDKVLYQATIASRNDI